MPLLLGTAACCLRLHADPPAAATPDSESAPDVAAEETLDPAAWGNDHVGQPLPEYLTGDECLFCHRDVGAKWPENAHQRTLRPASLDEDAMLALSGEASTADVARAVKLLLGTDRHMRFLRRSDEYGKLHLLSTAYRTDEVHGELIDAMHPEWDDTTFADKCAGCHATAVDPTTRAFSAISLDCYTCHGNVPLQHSKDTSLVHLSAARQEAREVISTCGQCHLRGGKSRSTGLPYPNNFVAGDNLFRDFEVNWDESAITALGVVDRHVYYNARDVAVLGRSEITCLSCHDVHAESTGKHQDLTRTSICTVCHNGSESPASMWTGQPHSSVCGY